MDFYTKDIKSDTVRDLLEPVLDDFDIRLEKLSGASWVHIDDNIAGKSGRYFTP
jgi:hypothetical protein